MSEISSPRPRGSRMFVKIVAAFLVVVILSTVGLLAYANIVMPGQRSAAIEVWTDPAVSVTSTDHSIVMTPTGKATGTGLVFIPGAKVDPYAYMYVLAGIVGSGVTVVITKPTLNLAFFDQRPLSTFTADAPAVTTWYVGGHSLGGVRACMLADAGGQPAVAGLVLFGSFCANDLSGSSLAALSLSGSDDLLSTPEKIAAAKHLLPADAVFTEIEGASHASFGNYGRQPGDGTATLSSAQVRAAITSSLRDFFGVN